MKKLFYSVLPLLAMTFGLVGCDDDNAIQKESVIMADSYTQNQFDKWLDLHYILPYNIEFKYRYEEIEADYNYYTVPALMENSIKMAHLVEYLCIETYNEVAGVDFTRRYFPKEFFLIGEFQYRNDGTQTLGTAEGGRKIVLMGINHLDQLLTNAEYLNHYYIKTIHHEFTHILNQTRNYPTSFKMVTGSDYVTDSWSDSPYNGVYLSRGFITAYAQMEDREDFAEMVAEYVTHDAAWWEKQMKAAETTYAVEQKLTGRELIEQKLDIVKTYMHDEFKIDLDVLRDAINRRQNDVISGKIDLDDIQL